MRALCVLFLVSFVVKLTTKNTKIFHKVHKETFKANFVLLNEYQLYF